MAREHIRAFRDVPGVRITGIHSRTRPRAESLAREFEIDQICDSVAELYDRTRADMVVVAVSEVSANEISRACFQFPWTVMLEKPPGYDLQDADEIHKAAIVSGTKVLVALNRRFNSSTRQVLAELGKFDGPRFIQIQDQQSFEEAQLHNLHPLVVARLMYANSIHVLDYVPLIGRGEIVSITPVIRFDPASPNVVVATIEFSSGDAGLYTGIWQGPGPWSVTVNTPERRWEMRPLEGLAFQNRGERRLNAVEIHEWDRQFKPGFRLQAEMAVKAALNQPSDSPTLDEAMRTMRLISAIFEQ
jgi:predicted dehydrogenase